MDINKILAHCDHTILAPTTTWEEVRNLCDDAQTYHVASVCIPPCYVKQASEYLDGNVKVCTVIGFPNGNTTRSMKLAEAREAIENGADEIDMVINVGKVKEKDWTYVQDEIMDLVLLVNRMNSLQKRVILKVIIETCLLTNEEIVHMCKICGRVQADYIKTSTGFSTGGATFEAVQLMLDTIKECGYDLKVKASGGISSIEDAEKYLEMGVDRLGTSKVVKIVKANT